MWINEAIIYCDRDSCLSHQIEDHLKWKEMFVHALTLIYMLFSQKIFFHAKVVVPADILFLLHGTNKYVDRISAAWTRKPIFSPFVVHFDRARREQMCSCSTLPDIVEIKRINKKARTKNIEQKRKNTSNDDEENAHWRQRRHEGERARRKRKRIAPSVHRSFSFWPCFLFSSDSFVLIANDSVARSLRCIAAIQNAHVVRKHPSGVYVRRSLLIVMFAVSAVIKIFPNVLRRSLHLVSPNWSTITKHFHCSPNSFKFTDENPWSVSVRLSLASAISRQIDDKHSTLFVPPIDNTFTIHPFPITGYKSLLANGSVNRSPSEPSIPIKSFNQRWKTCYNIWSRTSTPIFFRPNSGRIICWRNSNKTNDWKLWMHQHRKRSISPSVHRQSNHRKAPRRNERSWLVSMQTKLWVSFSSRQLCNIALLECLPSHPGKWGTPMRQQERF